MGVGDSGNYDLSMYLYETLKEHLISKKTAIALARLLIEDRFGHDEVARQEPLSIHEDGDAWVVLGSGQPDWNDGGNPTALRFGRVQIVVSQLDCRILKLAREAPIPPPDHAS